MFLHLYAYHVYINEQDISFSGGNAMGRINVLTREQFDRVLSFLALPQETDSDVIYKIYLTTCEAMQSLVDNNILGEIKNVNSLEIVYYCIGEYIYTHSGLTPDQREKVTHDDRYIASVASVASDKYLSLSMFNHTERKLANKFIPPISSINLYLNFMLNILKDYEKNDPKSTLLTDLLMKSVSISRCILNLIIEGYETEAFSTWRTLHECESTLMVFDKYGDSVINRYLIHMQYGIVFKKEDLNDEFGNKIFADMKEEMKKYNLKSKDIKKFIEYGWLYSVPGVAEDETFKLNFRDGLQKVAGLSMYSDRYEMSSEIIHSTPMLIYSNKEYFYYITLLSLYESFFRLEKVFVSIFSKRVSQEQMNTYIEMRNVYYAQLVNIHKREIANFQRWQQSKKQKTA